MTGTTPGLPRRLASMVYEAFLLFAVAFFAAYFLWCWLRGGQTLAMKAWRIRLVDVTALKALVRFGLALVLVPTLISIVWSFFDRERQFLHDRLAGTRLVAA